jgi:LPXTG-motif cell wall-anchored protein
MAAAAVAVVIALMVAFASPAGAAQVTETVSIPLRPTDFSDEPSAPQFNPSLGVLTGVQITATVNIVGGIQIENLSPTPIQATLALQSTTTLTGPSFGPVNAQATTEGVQATLGAFDGTEDFAGPSAATFSGLQGSGQATVNLDSGTTDLTAYVGTGVVEFPLSTNTTFAGEGPGGNVLAAFTNQAAVEIQVVYTYQAPAIDIEKATNGEDADDPPGPTLIIGDPVNWTYVVTNTGEQNLVNVVVTDDQGVAVACPQNTLAVGEVMTCTASGIAVEGQYANIGTVTGVPETSGPNVTDSDPSHYNATPPTTVPPTTVPPPPPTSVPPPQLPETGSSSLPLGVLGTTIGLLGLWGILAARKLVAGAIVDRDVDALAKELPTWQDPAGPR